jgi:nickel-dependent lactate racemase
MKIRLPYGKTIQELTTDDSRDVEILERTAGKKENGSGHPDEDEIVLRAMGNPIGSAHLSELAKEKENAVIICSDHTRPVPSKKIIPHMLRELRSGNPDIRVKLYHKRDHRCGQESDGGSRRRSVCRP